VPVVVVEAELDESAQVEGGDPPQSSGVCWCTERRNPWTSWLQRRQGEREVRATLKDSPNFALTLGR
jgi:hypothetical protein